MDRRSEPAASADAVREGVSAQHGIPAGILVPTIDPILQVVDDHVLFPISDSWSRRRWARVSNLSHLMRSCFLSRKILVDKTLMLFVMPYMPVKDAYDLYRFVENRGSIILEESGANEDVGSCDCKLPVWGRHGYLLVNDPDSSDNDSPVVNDLDSSENDSPPVIIKFCVINYGLLKAKAQEHERFVAIMEQVESLRCKMELQMSELLNDPELSRRLHPEHMNSFENAGRIAQEELLLSLYMHDMDPHDYISDLDTDVHDHIYDHDSDPCENPNAPSYEDMPEEVKTRLDEYMNELVALGRQVTLPKKAELEVLAAEGDYDTENVFTCGSKSLEQVLCNCNKQLHSLIADFRTADSRYSLIGVKRKRTSAEPAQNLH